MKILFVRHGVTKNNKLKVLNGQKSDEPLEPEGFEQARETAKKLPNDLVKIYASDMIRTVQTAETINEILDLEIIKCPELREVDFGSLTGKKYKDSLGNFINLPGFSWKDWEDLNYDLRPLQGESAVDVKNRVSIFIDRVKNIHKADDKILVVTHGGILRLLYFVYKKEKMNDVKNASIHEFEFMN